MIYYLFILDVNFLKITAVPDIDMINRINPANKILIISSLILFYSIPILLNKSVIAVCKNLIVVNRLIIFSVFFFILAFFFNYSINYSGGGIFFKFSYFFLITTIFFNYLIFIFFIYWLLF